LLIIGIGQKPFIIVFLQKDEEMTEVALSPAQTTELNKKIAYRLMLGGIHIYMAPLLVSYKASNEKIREILIKATWVEGDPLEKHHAQTQMVGTAVGFKQFLVEMSIVGLARALESALIDIKKEARIKYDVWRSPYKLVYDKQVKSILSLNNIVKHNQGKVSRNSEFGKFLINNCGIVEGMDIATLGVDFEAEFCHIYMYLIDLLQSLTDIEHPYLAFSEEEQRKTITELFLPEFLRFS
jgi:hypothetical protein